MSILTKYRTSRNRKRTVSTLDAPYRIALRRIEQRLKFLLSDPIGLLLRPKRAELPLHLSEVKSILILRYDALGDVVLTTPVWRSIKKYAPHIRIGVAGSARNKILLLSDPDIDDVFILDRAPSLSVLRELLRARKTKWNAVLNLFFHDKTRAAIYSKIMAPDGISVTIVREKKEKYERIYSHIGERPPNTSPMVLQNLRVLQEAVNIPIIEGDTIPSLKLDTALVQNFSAEISQQTNGDPFILINLDASQSYKEWGFENSYELAKRIQEERGIRVVWTCSPQNSARAEAFLRSHRSNILFLHTPSILHLAIAVKNAVAVISPDTSVIHFAAAQQVPVVGLYLEQNEFQPFGGPSRVCFSPDRKTMTAIPVDLVLQKLTDLLETTGSQAASV